jgi:O-antigen/teichoic acid export membrane protein
MAPLFSHVIPELTGESLFILRVLSLSCIINGMSHTGMNILKRQLEFKFLNIGLLIAQVIGQVGVGLTLAFLGFGVWSLVFGALTQVLIMAVLILSKRTHAFGFKRSFTDYWELIKQSSQFSLLRILEAINRYLPTFCVAFYLGVTATGLFDRVFMLVILPLEYVSTSLSKVLFPVFSQFQGQTKNLARAFKTTITLVSSVVLPTAAGMAVAGDKIVLTVLGPAWASSIPFLSPIAAYAGLVSVTHFFGVLIDAHGYLKPKMLVQTFILLFIVSAFIMVEPNTFHLLFYILISAELFKLVVFSFFSMKLLACSPMDLVLMLYPSMVPTLGVAGAIYGMKTYLDKLNLPATGSLTICILTGLITLAISLRVLWVFIYPVEIKKFLSKQTRPGQTVHGSTDGL